MIFGDRLLIPDYNLNISGGLDCFPISSVDKRLGSMKTVTSKSTVEIRAAAAAMRRRC
jgi:hypothetical protein